MVNISNVSGVNLTPQQFKTVYNNIIKPQQIQTMGSVKLQPYNGKWVVLKKNKLYVKHFILLNNGVQRYYLSKRKNKKGITSYIITLRG